MIDFPASPTVGQEFTFAGVTWTWDGTKWLAAGTSPGFLPLTGGVLTGNLGGVTADFSGQVNAQTLAGPTGVTPPVAAASPPVADNSLDLATTAWANANVKMGDNRLINGDMRVDQRGVASGAGGTAAGYTIDRWQYSAIQAAKGTWTRSASSAPGFPYALMFTSSSAYAVVNNDIFLFLQNIEADMISDFAWGTPNAQPVTLSFWAYSSLIGTFSGGIRNLAIQRAYPFTYSIPTANTWTKISVTIPGDTGGAWPLSGSGIGATLGFSLGAGTGTYSAPANVWGSTYALAAPGSVSVVGTNGAIFQITGVKLEIGPAATPFNRQSLAKSLADCQRYYQARTNMIQIVSYINAGADLYQVNGLPVTMRVAPTVNFTAASYSNCSAATLNQISQDWITAQASATATGTAFFTITYEASAEL
jgi:hypothetical protein